MIKRILAIAVFFVFICNSSVFAKHVAISDTLNWKYKGEVSSRIYQDAVEKSEYDDKMEFDGRLRLENRVEFSERDISVQINGEVRYEKFRARKTTSDVDLLLREAYVDMRRDKYSLSVGRQVATWGKLDEVVILDQVSPQDYRWFVLLDKEERKEPSLMCKYTYFGEGFQVEGIYLPVFKPSKVTYFGPGWSLFGRLQNVIADGTSYTAAEKSAVSRINITEQDSFDENSLDDGEAGVRFRSKIGDVDYSLSYFYFHNRIPVLRENTLVGNALKAFLYAPTDANLDALVAMNPSNQDLTLFKEYDDVHMVGVDAESVLGEFGLRGECGVFFDLPYLRSDFSYVRKNTIKAGLGIDHTTASNIYLNLQFIETAILNYKALFAQEEFTHEITTEITKDFFRGDVICSVDYTYNVSQRDWMVNPEVQYVFKNGVKVAVGAFVFRGGSTTIFGRHADRDLVYIEAKCSF